MQQLVDWQEGVGVELTVLRDRINSLDTEDAWRGVREDIDYLRRKACLHSDEFRDVHTELDQCLKWDHPAPAPWREMGSEARNAADRCEQIKRQVEAARPWSRAPWDWLWPVLWIWVGAGAALAGKWWL